MCLVSGRTWRVVGEGWEPEGTWGHGGCLHTSGNPDGSAFTVLAIRAIKEYVLEERE